jgi:hypothetical protein
LVTVARLWLALVDKGTAGKGRGENPAGERCRTLNSR